eukprot:TRINITY_DN5780_c0_g1_i2.p1 TRINITY_DN5780_c0_g1~~TRINITY_DN5780_c0_g1_i2.p1  ORF type:complete len:252 (-),score=95.79 TRINITY_DN5780_c0_g1_i2:279-980(-)
MESFFFSSGTESAVKTWQATVCVREDGVMTPQLLALLFCDGSPSGDSAVKQEAEKKKKLTASPDSVSSNSSSSSSRAPAATRERPEIERYARTDIESSKNNPKRVFLLGENWWEEPGRISRDSRGGAAASAQGQTAAAAEEKNGGFGQLIQTVEKAKKLTVVCTEHCFQCRGEGNTVCMECEGTGDLNIEEQFLLWAGEDAKCLYCDGTGAVACDECRGSSWEKVMHRMDFHS